MTYHSVDQIFAEKETILKQLDHRVRAVDGPLLRLRPPSEAWSIEEILEHLSIVERALFQLIESLLKKAETSSKNKAVTSPFEVSLDSIIERGRAEKFITRDKFEPTGSLPIGNSLAQLQDVQAQLSLLRPRLECVDPACVSFPHWAFGPLSLGQWLAFIGFHEQRHLGQIEAILASPEFLKRR